ncbi:MAG: hypothetical protein MJ079_02295 [Ruminococcus sp.]|nr:hypothetical protein [Ruminococcus sp.]
MNDVDNYRFYHTPAFLQGHGNTHLQFTASPDIFKAIEDEYAPGASSSIKMTNEYAIHISYNDEGFRIDTEATVYTPDDSRSFNHPHYTVLITSKDHKKIEFYSVA